MSSSLLTALPDHPLYPCPLPTVLHLPGPLFGSDSSLLSAPCMPQTPSPTLAYTHLARWLLLSHQASTSVSSERLSLTVQLERGSWWCTASSLACLLLPSLHDHSYCGSWLHGYLCHSAVRTVKGETTAALLAPVHLVSCTVCGPSR